MSFLETGGKLFALWALMEQCMIRRSVSDSTLAPTDALTSASCSTYWANKRRKSFPYMRSFTTTPGKVCGTRRTQAVRNVGIHDVARTLQLISEKTTIIGNVLGRSRRGSMQLNCKTKTIIGN